MLRAIALLLPLTLSLSKGTAFAEETLWNEGAKSTPPATNLQQFVKLAGKLGPTVVNVVAITNGLRESIPLPDPSAPDKPHPRGKGQGTGFIIHKSGFILTNTHVIEGADDIRVRLADERELTAHLVGKDDRTDIALLKIESPGELPTAPLGNSDEVQIGEWVVAIGNPFGLDHTVTAGIVSAKGRRDVRPGGTQSGYYDFIQTDASINPGNSGGPLINTRGEVIGINTAMNAQGQGIGFAIPINMAKVIAPLLKSHGRAPRSWLGIYPQPITQQLKKAFGLGDTRGALLADVVSDSPAAHVGLRSGDVVTELDGKPIRRSDDLVWAVATAAAGKKISVTVVRGGKPFKVEVTPVAAPDEPATPPATSSAPPGKKSALGMSVSEISPSIARELGNPNLHGVVVMSVEPESPAVEADVERGDIIVSIADSPIATLEEYAKAVRAVPHGEMIRMLVKREGKNLWLAFQKR
jgi:serine protease Do